jgi:hypothetical protein
MCCRGQTITICHNVEFSTGVKGLNGSWLAKGWKERGKGRSPWPLRATEVDLTLLDSWQIARDGGCKMGDGGQQNEWGGGN